MALPALLLSAAALAGVGATVDPAAEVVAWTVDAGTSAALVEDHRAPTITVRIEFPAGKYSPWVRAHHAVEAFEHQDDDPARALKKRADALAAEVSLEVDDRAATIEGTCLSADLDALLALMKDVLTNRDYDEKELRRAGREQSIEWKGNDTNVSFRMHQSVARAMFRDADDPRRLRWEKPPSVETGAAALAEARDALVRIPGRVVGFAGDLTRAQAERAMVGLLPPVDPRAPEGLTPRFGPLVGAAERPKDTPIRICKLTQVYFALGRDSLPWDDPRRPAYLVANHVLGGHFYSRLYVALRHEGGETYGAGTREEGDVAPGLYAAATFTRAPNAKTTETKLRGVLDVFHAQGITEEERKAAIGYLTGSRAFGRQSPEQILERYLVERRLGLPPGKIDADVDRAAALSLDEINRFIDDFYDPAQFTMVRAVAE